MFFLSKSLNLNVIYRVNYINYAGPRSPILSRHRGVELFVSSLEYLSSLSGHLNFNIKNMDEFYNFNHKTINVSCWKTISDRPTRQTDHEVLWWDYGFPFYLFSNGALKTNELDQPRHSHGETLALMFHKFMAVRESNGKLDRAASKAFLASLKYVFCIDDTRYQFCKCTSSFTCQVIKICK